MTASTLQQVNLLSSIFRAVAQLFLALLLVLASGMLGATIVQAGNEEVPAISGHSEHVTATMMADTSAVVPGKPFKLAVNLVMAPGWHTYYKESGDAGMATSIKWSLPPGFKASELLWEKPSKFKDGIIVTYGYADRTLVGATITPPADMKVGTKLNFGAAVRWLECKDQCIPGSASLALELASASTATPVATAEFSGLGFNKPLSSLSETSGHSTQAVPSAKSFSGSIIDANLQVAGAPKEEQNIFAALGLAFVGGFILNFMPCVLPVISIKVLSFMKQAGDDPKRVFKLGLTFTAGIISSFMVLAALVIGVQAAGQKIGWGFQFQFPIFLLAMATIVLLFALSLFGLFYVQVSAGQDQIDKLASKEGFAGTFFKGVLATTLSTPCSAPFLGTALGFAFSQPPAIIALIFFTISIGMAFPYVLLTAQPAWMKYLPKPGVWMEKFKESMGFLLLATVVWLVWVLGQQVGLNAAMAAVGFLVALSFAVWLVGRFTDLTSSSTRKSVVYSLAAVTCLGSYFVFLAPNPALLSTQAAVASASPPPSVVTASNVQKEGIDWIPFSLPELDHQLATGKTVFIDFTADWCLTCKVNESTVIATQPVVAKLKALNVVTMRADWTKQDPDISKLLQKFGRSGVPLYVIFPANDPTQPIVLPEVITQSLVIEKLDQAGPSKLFH